MNNLLEELDSIYRAVINSEKSDFYRLHYGENSPSSIDSWESWHSLPLLTRSNLQSVPLRRRLFVEPQEVTSLRMTSGTSGRGTLISPKTQTDDYLLFLLRLHNPKGIIFFSQHPYVVFQGLDVSGINMPVICGDLANVVNSLELAIKTNVDCVYCYTFHLQTITKEAQRTGLTERIRVLVLTGDCLTASEVAAIQADYPKAFILNTYGFTELPSNVGVSPLKGGPFNVLNPFPPHYWEIVDENGHTRNTPGAEGRVIITTLPRMPLAMPMLRYDTGDRARIVEINDDHFASRFELLGRLEIDIVKLPGGLLKTEEIERVLSELQPELIPLYQIHYYKDPKPRLELHTPIPIVFTLEDFASKLRISPTLTYSEAVVNGLYHLFTVVLIDKPTAIMQKRIRIVRH